MGGSPNAMASLCDALFAAAKHLHGLTKTARPVLMGAAAGAVNTLSAPDRRIARAALTMDGTDVDDPVGEDGVAVRVAALLRVATAMAQQDVAFLGLADDGNDAHLVVSGNSCDTASLTESLALWNRLCPRPLSVASVPRGLDLTCRLLHGSLSTAEATRRVLQRQMEQFITRSYGLAYNRDIEFVHEMRVATRRMRAALRTFKKVFSPAPDALKAELKSLGAELGVVRDQDVFLAFLVRYVAENDSVIGRALIRSVRRTRREAYRDLVSGHAPLRSYEACRRPPGGNGALVPLSAHGEKTIASQAPRLLHKLLKRIQRHQGRLGRLSAEEQHRLRIECKKLRYAGEFLADIYPRELGRLVIEPAQALQDALGEVHDCDVFGERIAEGCRRARAVQPEAVAAMRACLKQRRTTHLRRAAARWRSFHSKKNQQRIAELIRSPLND